MEAGSLIDSKKRIKIVQFEFREHIVSLGCGDYALLHMCFKTKILDSFAANDLHEQVPHNELFLQILFTANWRGCSSFRKESVHRYTSVDNPFFGISNGTPLQKSCLSQATGSFFSGTIENTEQQVSTVRSLCENELDKINYMVYDMREALVAGDLCHVRNGGLTFVDSTADVSPVENLPAETFTENTSSLIVSGEPGTISTVDISPDTSVSLPDTLDLNQGSLPDAKASFDDFSSGINESLSSSLNQGENAVKHTLDSFSSSVTSITKNASQAVDSAFNTAFSTLDQTGDIAGDKFSSFSAGLKDASNRAASVAIELLRQSVSIAESSLANGVSFVVYSYGSAKQLLPPDVKSVLTSSEDVALKVLSPLGAVLKQVLFSCILNIVLEQKCNS